MTIEVTFLELVGLMVTLLGGFWGLAKMLINTTSQHLDERFDRLQSNLSAMQTAQSKASDDMHRIDRELMSLRAELPEKYVLRDDFVRYMGEVRLAIDALALRFENVLLRGKNAD